MEVRFSVEAPEVTRTSQDGTACKATDRRSLARSGERKPRSFQMTNRQSYSEETYLAAFKRVRNQIRKYYAPDIILLALAKLHSHQQDDIESLRRQPPWFLLLLIKWTIVYGDFVRGKLRQLTNSDFNRIVNLMHDVDGSLRLPSDYNNSRMFLRGMVYQQFWHQEKPSRSGLSRQAILFRHLDISHRFRRWFNEQTKTEIDGWIDLSFMLLAGLLAEDRHSITGAYFAPVEGAYSSDEVTWFLKSISKTPEGLRRYLRGLEEEKRRDSSEFRERSPLIRFPLLELADGYYYYSIYC